MEIVTKILYYSCDQKALVASAHSFTLWQQVTWQGHYIIVCSHDIYGCYSLRTSPLWWIAHPTSC